MKRNGGLVKRSALLVSGRLAAVLVCLAVGGAAWAVVPAHCIAIDVPAPFVLPDGTVYPAGELRLCLNRNFNPVTGLHRVYIEHMPVGFLMSRVTNAETPKEAAPSALFYAEGGRLRLVGYTVASNGKVFSYRLWNSRALPGVQIAGNSGGSSGLVEDPASSVLLAARLE
jgi:hypothetical protein